MSDLDAPSIVPLCTYGSKPCTAPRARKENGELHRLCAVHRDSANATQRRWHARRQSRKRARLLATHPLPAMQWTTDPHASVNDRRATAAENRKVTTQRKGGRQLKAQGYNIVQQTAARMVPWTESTAFHAVNAGASDGLSEEDWALLKEMFVMGDEDDADEDVDHAWATTVKLETSSIQFTW